MEILVPACGRVRTHIELTPVIQGQELFLEVVAVGDARRHVLTLGSSPRGDLLIGVNERPGDVRAVVCDDLQTVVSVEDRGAGTAGADRSDTGAALGALGRSPRHRGVVLEGEHVEIGGEIRELGRVGRHDVRLPLRALGDQHGGNSGLH